MEEPVRVRLEMTSYPENVALVRAALSGLAAATELDDELAADLKTAISEACNNVVLHAYDGGSGPLTVEITGLHNGISAVVSDRGMGITRISSGEDRVGLGLAIMSALADRAEFRAAEGGGTEVRMWFARDTAIVEAPSLEPPAEWAAHVAFELIGDLVTWLSPANLARSVLGRVFRSTAAAAHFSVGKLSEFYALNDAIAQYVELAADGQLGVAISSSSRRISITGGPFRVLGASPAGDPAEGSRELDDLKQAGGSIVDTLTTERLNSVELLHLVLVDTTREGSRSRSD